MPFELSFTKKQMPAGFCVQSRMGPGKVPVCVTEFVSSEDGDLLVTRLEGISQMIFAATTPTVIINPSTVEHFLAIVRPDATGTLYINELSILTRMQSKVKFTPGELVGFDDIADVQRMRVLHDDSILTVPNDAGVVLFFSVGWRKGLYYDFSPLPSGKGSPRQFDIEVLFGQLYAHLAFQERLRISAEEFEHLIDERWFPFISLKRQTISNILNYVRSGWAVDKLLDQIHEEVVQGLPGELSKWKANPLFEDHIEVLQRAVDRFLENDFISAASILFPRIEGVLRTYHILHSPKQKINQDNLIQSAITSNPNVQHQNSLLLPAKFRTYLQKVFFVPFDPKDPQQLSRHTVAHGVTPVADFDKKGATLGFLILQQLSYYLVSPDDQQMDACEATEE
jgi:hypothetical protein